MNRQREGLGWSEKVHEKLVSKIKATALYNLIDCWAKFKMGNDCNLDKFSFSHL